MRLDDHTLARLRSQMSRAQLVLFTGAGFSLAAKDRKGRNLPSVSELKRELWSLCFPSTGFDSSASLGDLFAVALKRNKPDLERLLNERLTVDPDSVADLYQIYFDLPWLRAYTLNVDDLEQAVSRKLRLARQPKSVSATVRTEVQAHTLNPVADLEVVHLNGFVWDPVETLTFSDRQYAERVARQEPWYARCVADLISRPVIFIGTELHEIPLWQHMELRKTHLGGGRDLRPTSLLITPDLNPAKQEILLEYRIEWFSGTAESFAQEVLILLQEERNKGFTFIGDYTSRRVHEVTPLVSEVSAKNPGLQTEYLMGEEPHWADLIQGRAIPRTHDARLLELAEDTLGGKRLKSALVVTGTAGAGKSTALMRLALKLTDRGLPVLWVDRDSLASPRTIRERVWENLDPLVLAIDDADLFGTSQLVGMLQDLVSNREKFLFVFAVRSSKLQRLLDRLSRPQSGVNIIQHVVPHLTDEDIDHLIEVLDRFNRLGVLKGLHPAGRRKALAEHAGRQLLVGMIQATSGRRFEERAETELLDLEGVHRYLYALVSVASSLRSYLTKDEIILASGDIGDNLLTALDSLVVGHLLVSHPPRYEYKARHRLIAELVFDKLHEIGELKDVLIGLAWAFASKVNPGTHRDAREWRVLRQVINHAFLLRVLGIMEARDLYRKLEDVLSFDYHYWLQRGSLEVERGDVKFAEVFLTQARSLASLAPPGDYRVDTEYGYMLMRKATERASQLDADQLLKEGVTLLTDVIRIRGNRTAYPFHVLGSQGLSWVRKANLGNSATREFLNILISTVEEGVRKHPYETNLKQLKKDLEKELLMTVVK